MTAETTVFGDGWYVVMGEVSRTGIDVAEGCTANLILADGASLTVTGETSCAGIGVRPGETLNIYGQQGGTGRLAATGGSGNGYAGGTGRLAATGGSGNGYAGGAGIGGGYKGDGGTVTIFGGTVTAEGGMYASGIGGGDGGAGGAVTIYGGTVTVVGKHGAQGLGGGSGRGGGANRIYGGTVTAEGGEGAFGIGGNTIELGDNMVMFNITDGEPGVEVTSGNYFRIRKSFTTVRPEPMVETFGSGWYVTVPCGVYIDTRFKPGSGTRVTMDVKVRSAREYWFGCWDRNYNDGAFAFGNDGRGIYAGYGNQGGTFGNTVGNGRHTVELDRNVVKIDGADYHSYTNETFALANSLYLFAQNRNGTMVAAGTQDSIVCYGCRISTNGVDGSAIPVRNFVPARTKDERQIVGLCDTVSGKFYAPHGGSLTLGYDGPTCEGGTIAWSDDAEVWVVTPNAGVKAVTITGLPEGDTVVVPPTVAQVKGVADGQIKVKSGAYDITGAFTVCGGAIALDPNGSVTIGGMAIPVKPVIGDLDEGEAFAVGEGSVTVTVWTIPGLKYALIRGTELGAITTMVVEPTLATEAQMTLIDAEPPEDKAFYKVVVSVP